MEPQFYFPESDFLSYPKMNYRYLPRKSNPNQIVDLALESSSLNFDHYNTMGKVSVMSFGKGEFLANKQRFGLCCHPRFKYLAKFNFGNVCPEL